MLTTKQISEIMNCGLWMARRRMETAGIKCLMKPFGHGRKAYWNITEAQIHTFPRSGQVPSLFVGTSAKPALK